MALHKVLMIDLAVKSPNRVARLYKVTEATRRAIDKLAKRKLFTVFDLQDEMPSFLSSTEGLEEEIALVLSYLNVLDELKNSTLVNKYHTIEPTLLKIGLTQGPQKMLNRITKDHKVLEIKDMFAKQWLMTAHNLFGIITHQQMYHWQTPIELKGLDILGILVGSRNTRVAKQSVIFFLGKEDDKDSQGPLPIRTDITSSTLVPQNKDFIKSSIDRIHEPFKYVISAVVCTHRQYVMFLKPRDLLSKPEPDLCTSSPLKKGKLRNEFKDRLLVLLGKESYNTRATLTIVKDTVYEIIKSTPYRKESLRDNYLLITGHLRKYAKLHLPEFSDIMNRVCLNMLIASIYTDSVHVASFIDNAVEIFCLVSELDSFRKEKKFKEDHEQKIKQRIHEFHETISPSEECRLCGYGNHTWEYCRIYPEGRFAEKQCTQCSGYHEGACKRPRRPRKKQNEPALPPCSLEIPKVTAEQWRRLHDLLKNIDKQYASIDVCITAS